MEAQRIGSAVKVADYNERFLVTLRIDSIDRGIANSYCGNFFVC